MKIIGWVLKHNPDCKYLAENSWFDHLPENWEEARAALGEPHRVDALSVSCTRRTRAFWTNMRLPTDWLGDTPPAERDPLLHIRAGWRPVGEYTITASWKGGAYEPYQDTTRPYLVVNGDGVQRFLDPDEAEGLMGIPVGGTAAPGMSPQQRLHGIGNGMDIRCLNRLFQHFTAAHCPPEEDAIAQHLRHPWKHVIAPTDGAKPLPVTRIAEWLTGGPCPAAQQDRTSKRDSDWDPQAVHPMASYLISEWGRGVDIRYTGPRTRGAEVPNNPSFTQWPEESAKVVNAELDSGRWLGPFICPPTNVFLQTPMAMVEQSDKYRHITNATMGACLNEHIPDPLEPIRMTTHREIQRRIRLLADSRGTKGIWMAKRDIKSAYRNLAIRSQDWGVAGVKIAGRYYVDTALNFGTRSSPDKFCELSDAMEWVLRRWGVECVHYIDDFIFLGTSAEDVAEQVRRFELVCAAFGVPIKDEKNVGPAQTLTVLGVEYDLVRGQIAMPERQIARIHAGCTAILHGGCTIAEAESLLGVITWASQCMPQVMPFTSRLWDATRRAVDTRHTRIQVSHGLRDDMRWWVDAISAGLGCQGRAILCVERTHAHIAHADAGTEWGVGALDAKRFYKAPLPDAVRARSMRQKREGSTFLELNNLLVTARILGPHWTGSHVRIKVDNDALIRIFRKGRGKRPEESDIVREIAILQVAHGWDWSLQWVPRELNEAADALSKNDMARFIENAGSRLTEVDVPQSALRLPSGRFSMPQRDIDAMVCASGAISAACSKRTQRSNRPVPCASGLTKPGKGTAPIHREIIRPVSVRPGSGLWHGLGHRVDDITTYMPTSGNKTGVRKYLNLLHRAGVPLSEGMADHAPTMRNNVCRFAIDELLSYEVWNADKARWTQKPAVAAATACKYVDEVAKYWHDYTGQDGDPRLHLHRDMKAFKEYLRRSLPHRSRQKAGVNATLITTMVGMIRRRFGHGSAQEALVSLMWAGLLRPGEAVTTPKYPQYDITRHPSRREVSFFSASGDEIQPGEGVPARMEFRVKYSKTDQRRMAATTVVVGPTGSRDFCPMSAMWRYLLTQQSPDSTAPLFTDNGKMVTYARLRHIMDVALADARMQG